MKPILVPAFILGAATTAAAQSTDISTMLANDGLAATESYLTSVANPDATDRFALGGVRFLGAIETALQTRYNTGINEGLAISSGLPILRLPLPPNPDAVPFSPDVIANMFAQVSDELALALEPLDTITDADEVGLVLRIDDLWFDIDQNGARSEGEGVMEIAGFAFAPDMAFQINRELGGVDGLELEDADTPPITIRFDTADAAWLSAYAHLLSGVSETILAVDPTDAITRVLASRAAYTELAPLDPFEGGFISNADVADIIDLVSMFLMAFDQPVDATHSRAAHVHFLGMIEDNKVFWSRVAAETDNEMEWIPNKTQVSALGIPFPEDIGPRWQAVLSGAERLLNGETLWPIWRLGAGAGLNVAEFFQNPPHLDAAGLIQGETFVPYLERGPVINEASLRQFEELVGGNAGLFMIILN